MPVFLKHLYFILYSVQVVKRWQEMLLAVGGLRYVSLPISHVAK